MQGCTSCVECLWCRPHELQKLNMLAQDPRPLQEKQSLLAQVHLLCSILLAGSHAAHPCVICELPVGLSSRQTKPPC